MPSPVVVGVDGSQPAQDALAWAAGYASERDAPLHVVTVYGPTEERNPHSMAQGAGIAGAEELKAQAQLAAQWREQQDKWTYDRAIGRINRMLDALEDGRPADVTPVAVEGTRPSRVLIEAAKGADLLVVGARGRGGFAGLVLGSVSQQLASHAPCPLTIVRGGDTP